MIEEAVVSLLNDNDGATGLAIADLGCSSGPNTLVLVSTAVAAVRRRCSELRRQPPELCVHLNDLPNNDFNLVTKSLATYAKAQESLGPPVLTSIVPGSFHARLFSKRSLHLVCSNASLQWLSKVSDDDATRVYLQYKLMKIELQW
jgi:salicylate 1-O-methyltransferase